MKILCIHENDLIRRVNRANNQQDIAQNLAAIKQNIDLEMNDVVFVFLNRGVRVLKNRYGKSDVVINRKLANQVISNQQLNYLILTRI